MPDKKDFAQMKKEISGSVANFKKEMEMIIGGTNSDDEGSSSSGGDPARLGDHKTAGGIFVSKQLSSREEVGEKQKKAGLKD